MGTPLWFTLSFFTLAAAVKIYMILTTKWCRSKICLIGKTAIVTGANTGIGYETALDFASRGAKVILACRDKKRAEEARDNIIKETDNPNVIVKIVDFASLESVRNFAEDINSTEERLDLLINNAGVGGIGKSKSQDGFNLLMQINYYSSFLLTHLLFDLLKKSGPSRIVNVASVNASLATNFDVNNIDIFPGIYHVYNNSKLCNILFTKELSTRLEGTQVTTYSLHPGPINTEIFRHFNGFWGGLALFIIRTFAKTPEEGAQTTLYTALTKGIENLSGEHFDQCARVKPYKTASVPGLGKKLWEKTVHLIKMQPDEIRI